MRYCSNCGKQIPEKAKFCTFCGHREDMQELFPPDVTATPESPEVIREFHPDDALDTPFTLLAVGSDFSGYRIVRLLNKDPEGFKYIVEKDGKQYVLKLFFKYKFSNLDTILGLQTRLKRLNNLDTANTAKVVEVNQNHDPAYMVSEFIPGSSLDKAKATHPERITEEFVREIARQLVQTAIAVRKQGLTLSSLTLSGIMVNDANEITILSSGVKYEEADERDEVFNIGVLLSQLLSKNALYKVMFDSERLRERKFVYIPGTSMSLNKLLADCFHRNKMQKHATLQSILKWLADLPPVDKGEIYALPVSTRTFDDLPEPAIPKPKTRYEWPLIIIICSIVLVLVLVSTLIFPRMLKSSSFVDDIAAMFENTGGTEPAQEEITPIERNARDEGETVPAARFDPPRTSTNTSDNDLITPPPTKVRVPVPASFVYIYPGSLGFNRSKDNPNDNVSLDGFYISKYELTQAEWNKYMMPASVSFIGESLPVDNIAWIRILHYCNARSENEGLEPVYKISGSTAKSVTCNFSANGYRLPTEAEWELAAKAGGFLNYSGSDIPGDVAWYRDNSGGKYRSGKGKEANNFGIYDMTGNVAEWCWDWYDAKYPNNLTTFINPTGPETGTFKVIRGGSVRNGEGTNLGLLFRDRGDPSRGYQFVGFRLVRRS